MKFLRTEPLSKYFFSPTEQVRLLSNIVCTQRRLTFEILRSNNVKIGMNTFSNKFNHLNKQIGLNALNLSVVYFKKTYENSIHEEW